MLPRRGDVEAEADDKDHGEGGEGEREGDELGRVEAPLGQECDDGGADEREREGCGQPGEHGRPLRSAR